MNMEKEEQELIFKLSIFEQQMQQLQQQLRAVEQGIIDLSSLNLGLDEIKGKKGEEILAPIGRGIFAKAKLISNDLIVDIGGKNFVKKSIDETKKILQEQIKKLAEIKKELNDNLESMSNELQSLVSEAERKEGK